MTITKLSQKVSNSCIKEAADFIDLAYSLMVLMSNSIKTEYHSVHVNITDVERITNTYVIISCSHNNNKFITHSVPNSDDVINSRLVIYILCS